MRSSSPSSSRASMRRGDAIGAVNVCARYSEATVNEWYLLIRKRELYFKDS
jgi:hypothetical protein